MYKFVNTDDQGASADPVAKSINVQTQALNNMGRTINGIAQTVVTLKNIALHRLKQEEKAAREKFKPKYIQIEYNWHHLFKNVNLYYFSKYLKNYDVYKILPYNNGLLKIDTTRPENNIYHLSNFVFIKR